MFSSLAKVSDTDITVFIFMHLIKHKKNSKKQCNVFIPSSLLFLLCFFMKK